MESMPFTGTDEIHMRAPTCKYADSKSGFNDMVGIEIRYRQGNLAVFFYFGWRRHSRIVSLPHGESVRRHSPSFPWKEVPRRGGGWLSPKYEREYEESGLSYRHPERSLGIFAIRGQGLTLSPHVPRTSPLFSSVFHLARTLSGSLRSPPSPRGEGFIRRYSFSTYACIRFEAIGEAVFSYRSLPHGGRLTIRDMLFFYLFSCPPGCFCFLPSHSPVFPCARKISRYARNDDMGKAVFSFR